MAVANFKKTLWEGALLANFHSTSIADVITTKPSQKDGEKIIFNRVGSGTLKDYTGSIAWDEINTTPVEMTFTQKKYFAFALDDVDKAQLVADVMRATTAEHGAILSETIDSYVITKAIAGVGTGNTIGSAGTPVPASVSNAYDNIVDLGTKLNKKKVPKSDRYVVINSDYLGLLSKDARFTSNPNVLVNGVVEGQKINGMQVVVSEEIAAGKVVALHKSAIGYDKQVSEMEALRLQTAFADGIRGLTVYDTVVLRPEAIAVLNYSIA
jgi:hypothetical protein